MPGRQTRLKGCSGLVKSPRCIPKTPQGIRAVSVDYKMDGEFQLLGDFDYAQTCTDASRRKPVEPGKPLHGLDRCRPDRHRTRAGQASRPAAARTGLWL